MTRRTLVGSLAVAATMKPQSSRSQHAPRPKHTEWKPKLGVLGPYTPANVEFDKAQGFTNLILGAGRGSTLDADTITDGQIEEVKATIVQSGMHVSALQVGDNSIPADLERRARDNAYFAKVIDLAGKLGVSYIGTQSGKDASKPFPQQVDEIVRVYNDKYFPACQLSRVRILW